MSEWLAILIIFSAGFILGRISLAVLAKGWGFEGDWLSVSVLSTALGLTTTGWVALILAELGLYSLELLGGFWFLAVASLLISLARKGRLTGRSLARKLLPGHKAARLEILFLGLWLLVAGWLFMRPHEFIMGAADAGVYVNLGASISKSGGLLIEDPTLAALDTALYPTLLRTLPPAERASQVAPYYILPGFYVRGTPVGQVTPQFYPLHPVWGAVAFGLGGLRTVLAMTGFWALLSSLSLYVLIREIAGRPAAGFTLLGLSLNALQIWFARYPTTEMLTQYLLWTGLWAMAVWLKDRPRRRWWGLVAGLALGQLFLTRIDAYFLLAIPITAGLWLLWNRRWKRAHWTFFGSLGLLTLHSFVHAYWQSRPYFASIFSHGLNLIGNRWPLALALLLLAGGVAVLSRHLRERGLDLEHFRRPVLGIAAALIVLLVAYAWFIRPSLPPRGDDYTYWYGGEQIPADIDRGNLIRLGWYLSPLGIVLATAGTVLMILRINRQRAILLAAGLIFSLLYIWRIQANPMQIYTMRRYVPAVLPLAIFAAAIFLGWFLNHRNQGIAAAAAVLSVAWLGGLLFSAQGFIGQVDYQGVITQFEELDARLAPHSILIFDDPNPVTMGDIVGTPLRFLYGHDVFSLRDRESLDGDLLGSTVRGWQAAGRTVYWVGEQPLGGESGLFTEEPMSTPLTYHVLEQPYDKKPSQVWPVELRLDIAKIR